MKAITITSKQMQLYEGLPHLNKCRCRRVYHI